MGKAKIYYYEIGDYLNWEEKMSIVKNLKSFGNESIPWKTISPNKHGDWISLRNDSFSQFIPRSVESLNGRGFRCSQYFNFLKRMERYV